MISKKKTAATKGEVNEQNVASLLTKGPKSNVEMREALGLSTQNYDQRLDRELQRLRKSGKLKLLNGRWSLNTTTTCPGCNGKGWVHEAAAK